MNNLQQINICEICNQLVEGCNCKSSDIETHYCFSENYSFSQEKKE